MLPLTAFSRQESLSSQTPHQVLQGSTCLGTQYPKCLSYSRPDSRVDGCPFLEQVVNAGEDVRFVVFMDDQVQGRLAFVGGQVHRIFVLLYQDLKAGKLAFLGCEVDGCEALRSAEHRMGEGPTPTPHPVPSGLGLSVPVSLGGVHNPLSPYLPASKCAFYEWI